MAEAGAVPLEPAVPAGWIVPDWNAPSNVRALMTTRSGGTSRGPWGGSADDRSVGGMNLGVGSGDALAAVHANRALLAAHVAARGSDAPVWLRQVHGTRVVPAAGLRAADGEVEADAVFADEAGRACGVLVADCVPVLFCDDRGTRVAAAHAGWRGLVSGVLEATVAAGGFDPGATSAWIGPCIGPTRFEVGAEVRDAFLSAARSARDSLDTRAARDVDATAEAFRPSPAGKWLADLPALARLRLAACGVHDVHASGLCAVSDATRFYSYRRDGVTGRMGALIWIERDDARD